MTRPNPKSVGEIADGLSKRLKIALLRAEPHRLSLFAPDDETLFAHHDQDALHERGLVTVVFGGAMLTQSGLEVRTHLQSRQREEG